MKEEKRKTLFKGIFNLKSLSKCSTITFLLILIYICKANSSVLTPELSDREIRSWIPARDLKRPKVGIALSGGGLRGLAHIGVLKVLLREGIPIDLIAGVSTGSVIGALCAAGYTPQEIEEISGGIDWDNLFQNTPERSTLFLSQKSERRSHVFEIGIRGGKISVPSSLSAGQYISDLLSPLLIGANFLASSNFDSLEIPFRAVATDLVDGEKIIFKEGDLSEALRASISVPLIFSPVEIGDSKLVDGGIVNNIPTDVVREMGADYVIAVDVSAKLLPPEKLNSPIGVVDQVTTIMMAEKNRKLLEQSDFVIRPKFDPEDPLSSLGNSEGFVRKGEEAAELAIPEILSSLRSINSRRVNFEDKFLIGSVKLRGFGELSEEICNPFINVGPGDEVCESDIKSIINGIYSLGYFPKVEAKITRNKHFSDIAIHVIENPLINDIIVTGNTIFSTEEILSNVQTQLGGVVNFWTGSEDLKRIVKMYYEEGYVLAQILRVDFDASTGVANLEIDEGRIEEVDVEGNSRTHDMVILREFPLQSGDIFNISKAKLGIRNIYGTGLFENVSLFIVKGKSGAKVLIKVKEKQIGIVRFGFHFNRAKEAEAFAKLVQDNLLGFGERLSLLAMLGEKRHLYRIEHSADRILKTYLTYNFSLFHSSDLIPIYSSGELMHEDRENRSGISISFGQQIYRLGEFVAKLKAEKVEMKSSKKQVLEGNNIVSIILSSITDTIDRFPFPQNGHRYEFVLEYSNRVLGSSVSYTKFLLFTDLYKTIDRKHTLSCAIKWGTADLTLPLSEMFKLGGEETLFGYHWGEFNGRQLLSANLGYRIWVPKYFYLSLRYDTGGVWKGVDKVKLSDVKHSFGIGGMFSTPVGPISLSYGRSVEGIGKIYFSVGYTF